MKNAGLCRHFNKFEEVMMDLFSIVWTQTLVFLDWTFWFFKDLDTGFSGSGSGLLKDLDSGFF